MRDESEDVDIYDDEVQEGLTWTLVSKQVEEGYFDD